MKQSSKLLIFDMQDPKEIASRFTVQPPQKKSSPYAQSSPSPPQILSGSKKLLKQYYNQPSQQNY